MTPIIAIVGRPNVGKSTLFNVLSKTRHALVANIPGTTRDRQFATVKTENGPLVLVDTGGIGLEEDVLDDNTTRQSLRAVEEASLVLFVVDAHDGLTPIDQEIASQLRIHSDKVVLIINKIDHTEQFAVEAEFASLGFKEKSFISAKTKRGINDVINKLDNVAKKAEENIYEEVDPGIKVAVVGRPNVGNSTLINRWLGEDRVIVLDHPGTTTDSVYVPFERKGHKFTLIDTAGVRKKAKVTNVVEKFSALRSLQAIEHANVVVCVVDAADGMVEQDLKLLSYAIDAGKCLVVAVNKWDNQEQDHKDSITHELKQRLRFADYALLHYISAKHGSGVGKILDDAVRCFDSATEKHGTSVINKILSKLLAKHQPPLVRGRRIKIRYAHFGGNLPPTIVLHGNQLDELPDSYKRYLIRGFSKELKLYGTPIRVLFRTSENPFAN